MAFAKLFRISSKDSSAIDPSRPELAWQKIKGSQRVDTVKPLPFDTPKPPGHTRFVCVSDTHTRTRHLRLPDGDVLLHAGDFSEFGEEEEVTEFREFLLSLSHPHKVVIAGNHEHTFDVENYDELSSRFELEDDCHYVRDILIKTPTVTYLEDSGTVINGINIWGSPWQPWFNDWAFNLPRGKDLQLKWDRIPSNTDVLMTHGPPLDYGITTDGHTVYINAAVCDFYKRPRQKPIVFDLPNKM